MTLKIRSRSPKFIQLFPLSQQCIYASLVKIHPLVQKIKHRNSIMDVSKCPCDLENEVKVTKSDQHFPSSQQCIYASFFKIHYLVQKIMHGNEKGDADAEGICTKNNISPTLRAGGHNCFLYLVGWLVGFVALRPKSTAMVIAGRSVHLTTLFPGQAWTSR